MICERCSKEIHKREKCDYCNRTICNSCVKSSRRVSKIHRTVICKDCWGKIPMRKKYKSLSKRSQQA